MILKRFRLEEAHITQIMRHSRYGFVLIPADEQIIQLLIKAIKDADYAYTFVYGGCYNGSDIDEQCPSVIVYNHQRQHPDNKRIWSELVSFAQDMCAKFEIDSAYIHAADETPHYINKEGDIIPFVADIQLDSMYRSHGPSSFVDRVRRIQYGEVIVE